MGDWNDHITGTPPGARRRVDPDAVVGLQKGRHDPWPSHAALDLGHGVMAPPVAQVVALRHSSALWWVLRDAMAIHVARKIARALIYLRANPAVRATAPLFAVLAAGLALHKHFNPVKWPGVLLRTGGSSGWRNTICGVLAWGGRR